MDSLDFLDRKPVGEAVHPWRLQVHGSEKGPLTLVGQDHKLRPPVMRVGFKRKQTLFVQLIDNPLHILTVRAKVAREPRNGLRAIGLDDGAEDLPAGAR